MVLYSKSQMACSAISNTGIYTILYLAKHISAHTHTHTHTHTHKKYEKRLLILKDYAYPPLGREGMHSLLTIYTS